MSGRYVVYPEKHEKIKWREIYDALTHAKKKHSQKSIEIIEIFDRTHNMPIPGKEIFSDGLISADEINTLLRTCNLSYRICTPEKNRSGGDRSKKWCIGISQYITRENRFQHLVPDALLKEFIELTTKEKGSAQWKMCREEILRRMSQQP